MLDATDKQLILDSEYAALVFGNGSDFKLIALDELPLGITGEELTHAGYTFAGVMTYANGKPHSKCQRVEMIPTMLSATLAFAEYVGRHLIMKQQQPQKAEGDSAAWLEKLFALEDPRDCN